MTSTCAPFASLGIAIFFLIPRQPAISFDRPITIEGESQSAQFNTQKPTNFTFDARLTMYLDGRGSYIPPRLRNFQVFINDLGSTTDMVLVGKGRLDSSFTTSTKYLTRLLVDLHFSYKQVPILFAFFCPKHLDYVFQSLGLLAFPNHLWYHSTVRMLPRMLFGQPGIRVVQTSLHPRPMAPSPDPPFNCPSSSHTTFLAYQAI